jgi:hypothetical protein
MNEYEQDSLRITQHRGAFLQPLMPWKSNKCYTFRVCICSLRYTAWNAHAPYHPWPARLYNIFSILSHKRKIFEKKIIEHEMCVWFSQQLLSETFLILRRTERDMTKNVYWSSCKVTVIKPGCNGTRIFSTYFRKKKPLKYHFNENPTSGSRTALCVREGARTDMKLTVAFHNFPNAPKNLWNDTGSRKRKYSEKILPQCHFVYHKSHIAVRKVALGCFYLRAPWSYRLQLLHLHLEQQF